MKVVIIFHSVCGNCYLVARSFRENLAGSCQVVICRVADSDWVRKPDVPEPAQAVLESMLTVPEARPQDLLDADLIILGSPTYFGNVSAEMKAFMDSTGGMWVQGQLAGKKLFAYTSAGNSEGGGDLCLQAIHNYGKYMGLLSMPLPRNILNGENVPALGIIHYSNGKYAESLDARTEKIVKNCCIYWTKKNNLG